MRLNRPSVAAPDHAPKQDETRSRGHRAGAGLVKLVSATAVVTATCAMFALPASAATASAHVATRHTTTTAVSASPSRAFTGRAVKLSAHVRSRSGTPTGSVVFTWNRRKLCTAVLHRGAGSCVTRFSRARTYLVVGIYTGSSRFRPSAGITRVRIVNPPPPPPVKTTTTVTATPSTGFVGAGVKLSATVTSTGSTPTGTVTFKSAAGTLCTAVLSGGSGSCASKFGSAGTSTVTGTYSGDARHLPSSGNTSLTSNVASTTTTITNKNPGIITVGKSYTFDVTVTSPAGAPAATGTVKLAPNTPPTAPGYTCTATLKAGKGTCTVTPSEYGIDNYTATYTGDAGHTGSTSDGMFALAVQNVTTTTVTAPSTTVGSVTLNALVNAMGANITVAQKGTGSVTFYLSDTAGTVGTAIPECAAVSLTTFTAPNNIATCTGSATLNGLKAGTYYITALFSGDPVNVESTSPQFTLTLS
jgi:large repetitive protein